LALYIADHAVDLVGLHTLKRAFSDGTVAVEMDPLSLLCRFATAVPPRRQVRRRARVGEPVARALASEALLLRIEALLRSGRRFTPDALECELDTSVVRRASRS
jgi:hypothetical protein